MASPSSEKSMISSTFDRRLLDAHPCAEATEEDVLASGEHRVEAHPE